MAAVTSPNIGLMFDRPPLDMPRRAVSDGLNFRVKNGKLESLNMGWVKFNQNYQLNGPVKLIDNFFPRNVDEQLIFASITDIYLYHSATDTVTFLTPTYSTGTASASGSTVTGVGTDWQPLIRNNDEIAFGATGIRDPDADWYVITNVADDTTLTIDGTTTAVNGPYTIRRKFLEPADVSWSVDTFVNDGETGDDLWFATNGFDPVITWNGVDDEVTLHPELQFTCQTLTTYSNMMIYGNITQGGDFLPSTIINSDVGLPLHAGATGTGLSEQFVVHSNTDPILNMVPLGDYLVIYAERTIIPAQFVGDPLIFMFRVAISGVGPVSGNAIADFGDFHEFLAADAGYLFDGVTLKETNSHVWRNILRQADPLRRPAIFAHFDEEQGDLIWSIPATTDPGVGVVGQPAQIAWSEHYLEEAADMDFEGSPFSKRQFPFTISGFYERSTGLSWEQVTQEWQEFNYSWNDQFFQIAFPLNLVGDYDGNIWVLNDDQRADGENLPSFVRTGSTALGSGRERGLLTRVYPFGASQLPTQLEVTMFGSDHLGAGMTNKGTQPYNHLLVEGGHFVTFYRRARAMQLQFGSAVGDPWIISGWDYDMVQGGRR